MIFYDIVKLNLKVGDQVLLIGRAYPVEVEISTISYYGPFVYNCDYTTYGIYSKNTQDRLSESVKDHIYLFKKLICNRIARIIPL
jgi:hypothetical protein